MNVTQPTLFELPPPCAESRQRPESVTRSAPEPRKAQSSVTIVKSLPEALKCATGGLCLICEDWPTFDPNDRAYFTPDSGKYIEAERLPPDWLALVGKTVCADRTTVGTIADLLEVLPADVANEWRELYAKSEEDDSALFSFEEAHRIRWYGEGYYLDSENKENEL